MPSDVENLFDKKYLSRQETATIGRVDEPVKDPLLSGLENFQEKISEQQLKKPERKIIKARIIQE